MLCLIDPSLQDHSGRLSDNLGDVVIYRAISRCLQQLFPGEELCRISSHEPLEERHYAQIAGGRMLLLGGSNLLSSDVLAYNQWNFATGRANYQTPRFGDAVLFGIGWWQYQAESTPFTADFYRRVLSTEQLHSVRDGYTAARLRAAGISNVVCTGCPSMWSLDGLANSRSSAWTRDCLMTITDYKPNPAEDDRFLQLVIEHFDGTLFLFPQGLGDVEYFLGLPISRRTRRRIEILDHSLENLERFLSGHPVSYVGTRLHGGIAALNYGVPSLILAVDNRAAEMARDFRLPVVPRADTQGIRTWLRGEQPVLPIAVPRAEILRWCHSLSPGAELEPMFTPTRSLPLDANAKPALPLRTRIARTFGL